MNLLSRIAMTTVLLISASHAGDNSQATLGDVKEAVYKLIVQSKKTESRIKTVEEDFSNAKSQKDDKLSVYIGGFVSSNKAILDSIAR